MVILVQLEECKPDQWNQDGGRLWGKETQRELPKPLKSVLAIFVVIAIGKLTSEFLKGMWMV